MDETPIFQTALDQLVSDEQAQLLKAAIPYLPGRNQLIFSVYAKVLELSKVLSLFSSNAERVQVQAVPEHTAPLEILQDISSYCYGGSKNKIDQIIQLISVIQLSQLLQEPVPDISNSEDKSF